MSFVADELLPPPPASLFFQAIFFHTSVASSSLLRRTWAVASELPRLSRPGTSAVIWQVREPSPPSAKHLAQQMLARWPYKSGTDPVASSQPHQGTWNTSVPTRSVWLQSMSSQPPLDQVKPFRRAVARLPPRCRTLSGLSRHVSPRPSRGPRSTHGQRPRSQRRTPLTIVIATPKQLTSGPAAPERGAGHGARPGSGPRRACITTAGAHACCARSIGVPTSPRKLLVSH